MFIPISLKGVEAKGLSNMKTDKKTVEQYVAPEVTQIDIMPEGILCGSTVEDEDGEW